MTKSQAVWALRAAIAEAVLQADLPHGAILKTENGERLAEVGEIDAPTEEMGLDEPIRALLAPGTDSVICPLFRERDKATVIDRWSGSDTVVYVARELPTAIKIWRKSEQAEVSEILTLARSLAAGKRTLSEAGRQRISAAQKRRWERFYAAKEAANG